MKNSFFSNKVFFNVSAFYTTVTNAQVPTLVLPDAVTITKNTGLLHSAGIEAELMAAPAEGFEISYNAGYTDAHYKNLKVGQNGNVIDLKNKRPVFTPDYTSMLAVQYNYRIKNKSGIKIMLRGELKSIGNQYFDLANTLQQKPYSLLNASAGISSKNCELIFWSGNITGKKYISYAYDFGAVHLGNPATYGVTVKINTSN